MGNDGGSIARRSDLARQKKVKSRVSCSAVSKAKANLCSLSQEPLRKPIVACRLGYLYNKISVLTALLKNNLPASFSHIKSLKDVKEVSLDINENSISCPISKIELNGLNPFIVLWNCGCLVSEKGVKEIPSENCLICGKEVTEKIKIGQSKEDRKKYLKEKGIKAKKEEKISRKKQKIIDEEEIDKNIENSMKSEVFQSLFQKNDYEETFCCRHLRPGLR